MQKPATQKRAKPVILCILDGWGHSDTAEANAIAAAHTPTWDRLRATYPYTTLDASELSVGLPSGQMGNSEVGHMNIGAGRVVMQDLPRIDQAIADGSLAEAHALKNFVATLKQSGGICHLMGLISDGGVHAHIDHLIALATIITSHGVNVALHAFTDGRDTAPQSALTFIEKLENALPQGATIATLSGRYYAMDRDNRWDRVARAYKAIIHADAPHAPTAKAAVSASYDSGVTDEFIIPTRLGFYTGIRPQDGLLMGNFRSDRVRQLLHAMLNPDFDAFDHHPAAIFAATLGMVAYADTLNKWMPALFHPQDITQHLGEVIATHGLTQLRIAETEKYAHVTFFFSGGKETPCAGETRILIPSAPVATYDLKPEMSAAEVTDAIVAAMDAESFDVIIVNYANTDMVGHSGNFAATQKAVEAVDACLSRLHDAVLKHGGVMLITADHGNAETMVDASVNQPHTAHTLNRVPFLLVSSTFAHSSLSMATGCLADIAPTMLDILGIEKPQQMTGSSLLKPRQHSSTHTISHAAG